MSAISLSDDEFRILAYIRAYADNRKQHLDPDWVREQLDLTLEQLQQASRTLARLGLAEFFEWEPGESLRRQAPDLQPGIWAMDICLTERGWNCLRVSVADV